jgi:hypothetical protein
MARELRGDPKHPKRSPHAPAAIALPGAGALIWCAAFALLMLLAPPQSNWVWAVNGFRSLPGPWSFLLLITAAASALLVLLTTRERWRWGAFSVAVAILAAFLLRERLHFLGDSDLRFRAISAVGEGAVSHGIGEWSQRLHAARRTCSSIS